MKIAVLAVHLDPDFVVREMEALYDVAPQCKEKGKTKVIYQFILTKIFVFAELLISISVSFFNAK